MNKETKHPNGARKEMVVIICEDMKLGLEFAREHFATDKVTYASIAYLEDQQKIVQAVDEVLDAND